MAKEDKKEQQSASLRVTAETQEAEKPQVDPVPDVDTEDEKRLLEEQGAAARRQAEQQIDYEVERGMEALRRAEEDAQPGFQSMRDRIAIDERQALDNQALYAEMRGDRGGIGQAQYASIQNTAAVNRRQVGLEQQRLAAETARQIEDLRREGEFRKADKVLELTQKQLSELMELERWAKEKNLSVAQFNAELARWEAEYAWKLKRFGIETELKLAQMSGTMPDGTPTYAARQDERSRLAAAAKMLLEAGLSLTPEQLEALGWTQGQYEAFINRSGAAGAYAGGQSAGSGGKSGGGGGSGKKKNNKSKDNKTKDPGAPFQLVASWASALQGSGQPAQVYEQIKASNWYAQMNEEQQGWINGILKERGIG
ncbi:MAG: hypothetical protein ACSW8E_02490 [Clostridia bacterium]